MNRALITLLVVGTVAFASPASAFAGEVRATASPPPTLDAPLARDSVAFTAYTLAQPTLHATPRLAIKQGSRVQVGTADRLMLLLPFLAFGVTLPRTRAMDKSIPSTPTDDVRANQSILIADLYYLIRNRSGSVAPVAARAANAAKIKTTNNTTFMGAGKPQALAAADNLWVLTGANLADGKTRKYRCLHDGTNASVQASSDGNNASLCDFVSRPSDGNAILAVATIVNASGAPFVPGTTALNATNVTTTFIDGSDSLEVLANQLTP